MLHNIQALRFFAAFAVVLFHSRSLFNELGCQGELFLLWAKWGSAGVDVFFVISGYVMWHTTSQSSASLLNSAHFARRRLFRIYLGYWPAYAIAAIVTLALGERILGNIYWVQDFFLLNHTIRHQLLGVSWTLTYELYFYALFSALLLLSSSNRRKAIVLIFLAIIIVNLNINILITDYKFILSPHLIEFFSGCLIAMYLGKNRSIPLLIAILVVFAMMADYATGLGTLGMPRVKGIGVASMCLLLAVVILENSQTYIASKFWIFLGDCSYSIYLLHIIVFWVYRHTLKHLDLSLGTTGAFLVYFSSLAVILLWSALNYRYVEKPLYKYALKNWLPLPRDVETQAQ